MVEDAVKSPVLCKLLTNAKYPQTKLVDTIKVQSSTKTRITAGYTSDASGTGGKLTLDESKCQMLSPVYTKIELCIERS